jgi:hypothetical protein
MIRFDPAAVRQTVLDQRRVLPLHPHCESIGPLLDLLETALDAYDAVSASALRAQAELAAHQQ